MNKDSVGIVIILGIIALAIFGGVKNTGNNSFVSSEDLTPAQKQQNIQTEVVKVQTQVEDLKKQVQSQEDFKTQSKYKNSVSLSINRSEKPSEEYITIRVASNATTSILVTGWTLKSVNGGVSVKIPKGTYLLFSGKQNVEEDIYLTGGDTLYLITGTSPNGASFKLNKCSGYLNQFQTFTPYISSNCPVPRDEDLSSIPKVVLNDACLDYIETFPQCRIQEGPLPVKWNRECTDFIINKISYAGCIETHKDDKDFYGKEWMVYLKRNNSLWKIKRENVILYDLDGKIVGELKY
ncbi:MAG: hypothetical protein WAX85_02990 [Minisyncoccia bacterium]